MRADEIVPVEIEIVPTTALIRKGHRIRLDVQPYTGVGHGNRHAYEPAHHHGAVRIEPESVQAGPVGRTAFVRGAVLDDPDQRGAGGG